VRVALVKRIGLAGDPVTGVDADLLTEAKGAFETVESITTVSDRSSTKGRAAVAIPTGRWWRGREYRTALRAICQRRVRSSSEFGWFAASAI